MHVISSQEFHVVNDHFVIRTRCPWNEITESMVLMRAGNNNLSAGDHILVQCFDYPYKTLLAEATYVVAARKDEFVTTQLNDRQSQSGNRSSFVIVRRSEWWMPFSESPGHSVQDLEKTEEPVQKTKKSAA